MPCSSGIYHSSDFSMMVCFLMAGSQTISRLRIKYVQNSFD
ncbi:hypothetical protein ENTCAN_09397 [Enterobacter cancerogenus ATCC 35316]|nr:hypothetical protein ENTCAN_09397 [Enterobacter cancerogenus ATCC 35316]